MKALSIRQPWAEMIMQGRKTIEVRGRNTQIRGRIAIHTGKTIDRDACGFWGYEEKDLVTGAIIGFAEIEATSRFETQKQWELTFDAHKVPYGYMPGSYAWIMVNPRRLAEPIPYRGQLGFFEVDVEEPPLGNREKEGK